MINKHNNKRRLLVPEVIQTSAMDCGPASLKCLLEGFGISVSYGRLREACQTDVDGTSIDTMEEVAMQLGLEAEQIMIPVDHLLLHEAKALPAIVVVLLPNGVTHFKVAWRRHGRFVQIMDPGSGRRWSTCKQFFDEVYVHTLSVPAAAWRDWAGTDEFLNPLRQRLANLGGSEMQFIDRSLTDSSWRSLAVLDAATRMTDSIVLSGGLKRGREATRVLEAAIERTENKLTNESETIPNDYWSVRPVLNTNGAALEDEEQLMLRGALLVRILGLRQAEATTSTDRSLNEKSSLSPELVAALEEPPGRPGHELLRLLRADDLLTPIIIIAALFIEAGGVIIEALLFRGLIDIGRELSPADQRLSAIGVLIVFVTALFLLELPIMNGLLRLGKQLEVRLRIAFLDKIPRLKDRYFQSRLNSDMAQRSHTVYTLRLLPGLGGQLIRSVFQLVLTTVGIIWLDPASSFIAITAAALSIGLPLIAQPLLTEQDLRVRTHTGALSRFYLDAFLGLIAVRTHGAERVVQREHESLLVEWARAGLKLQRTVVSIEGVQLFIGFGIAAWLLIAHLARGGEFGVVLLLVYWALTLPMLGQEVSLLARQYPIHRNVTQRLLEPLGAPEEIDTQENSNATKSYEQQPTSRGVAIAMEGVSIRASGHTILERIDFVVEAKSHIAIIGPSGAGKSSLVGILLGWHRPATGQVLVDGKPLSAQFLDQLRLKTAWVDPTVQLWNHSFIHNLQYGNDTSSTIPCSQVIEQANLLDILAKLPEGLQTVIGEGGALVSGGEGQRVRLGRAMLRRDVDLVILDEPFRSLDREQRRELISRARKLWQNSTLLCITHDISETLAFERVLVMEHGRIVEDGAPGDLIKQSDSRYLAMLNAEKAVREGLWSKDSWRRLRLEGGRFVEKTS